MRGRLPAVMALVAAMLLAACVSVEVGNDVPAQALYRLHDAGAAGGAPAERRAAPLVPALLIQAQPADATADALSIAYSTAPNRFAHYQLASWTDRPVKQLSRLLQRRLETRGIAGAVGLVGDPLRADWWLAISVETLHHDVNVSPGQGRLAFTAELFDRRSRERVARRRFEVAVPAASADSAGAAAALSAATGQSFDALLPWLEGELQRSVAQSAR